MVLQIENILGSENTLSLSFNNDKANTIYRASYTNPYFTIDGISRTVSFSYRQRDASEQDISNFLSNSYGANINYGVPLTEYDRVSFGIGVEHTDIIRSFSAVDEIVDFINIYDIANQLERMFPYMAIETLEIEGWVTAKDVFDTVVAQDNKREA